jgi:hypothetical protein
VEDGDCQNPISEQPECPFLVLFNECEILGIRDDDLSGEVQHCLEDPLGAPDALLLVRIEPIDDAHQMMATRLNEFLRRVRANIRQRIHYLNAMRDRRFHILDIREQHFDERRDALRELFPNPSVQVTDQQCCSHQKK